MLSNQVEALEKLAKTSGNEGIGKEATETQDGPRRADGVIVSDITIAPFNFNTDAVEFIPRLWQHGRHFLHHNEGFHRPSFNTIDAKVQYEKFNNEQPLDEVKGQQSSEVADEGGTGDAVNNGKQEAKPVRKGILKKTMKTDEQVDRKCDNVSPKSYVETERCAVCGAEAIPGEWLCLACDAAEAERTEENFEGEPNFEHSSEGPPNPFEEAPNVEENSGGKQNHSDKCAKQHFSGTANNKGDNHQSDECENHLKDESETSAICACERLVRMMKSCG